MNVLLKSAKIMNAATKDLHRKKRDILVRNGKIEKIGTRIEAPSNCKVIETKNLHVSLGWFDSGVSFGEPGYEDRETIKNGLATAARSGFTDIVLNTNTLPVPDSSSHIVFVRNAGANATTVLHPLGCLTKKAQGEELAELFDMQNAGAVGFYDYKTAIKDANLLKIALQYAQGFNACVSSFPADMGIQGHGNVNEGGTATHLGLKGIPALAEELQISRDLAILEYTGGKLHIPTISSANSVKLIAAAKRKGLDVSCSAAIHHLYFTDAVLNTFDTHFKVAPPLRTQKDQKALLKGLRDGTIDFITSDHSPCTVEEKHVEFDNAAYGSLGLESTFGILNKILGTEEAIALLGRGRERYGLKTPILKEGETACLTLFNPDIDTTLTISDITTSSKNSMFLGQQLKGKVFGVVVNTKVTLSIT